MDYLREMMLEESTPVRWKTLFSHYEGLSDGDFPKDLEHPKWFSLPPHIYDAQDTVVLEYRLLRPLVLVDMRGFSDVSGTSKIPHQYASFRSEMDDMKMLFATCMFAPNTWPYEYYMASEYDMSCRQKELIEALRDVDGWIAHDCGDTSWAEIVLVHPRKVIDPNFRIV